RAHIVEIAVPDLVGVFRQGDALQLPAAGPVEEAQLDLLGMRREEGEIHSRSVPGRPERIGEPPAEAPHAAPSSAGARTNAAKGGRVSSSVCGCPCRPSSLAATLPPLPTFEPP